MQLPFPLRILSDNRLAENGIFLSEHGFSLWMQMDGKQWLLDTGGSDVFSRNAKMMGISLEAIDYLILSHAHKDHSGGLECFLSQNTHAQIIASDKLPDYRYFTSRSGILWDISPICDLLQEKQFYPVSQSRWITDNVAVVFTTQKNYPTPKANAFLTVSTDKIAEKPEQKEPDTFDHEIAVAIRTNMGLVVLSGCAHAGVLNILDACTRFCDCPTVYAFVGGLHLPDGPYETAEEVDQIALQLKRKYPNMKIFAGHCTGDKAIERLALQLGSDFEVLGLNRVQLAVDLFKSGYNCAQAVLGAFAPLYDMPFSMACKLACPFGGGVGRLRLTCGAASGLFLVSGLAAGNTDPKNKQAKDNQYKIVRALAQEFVQCNGGLLCSELLGKSETDPSPVSEPRTETYYKKRPCVKIVENAARIAQAHIDNNFNDFDL